MARNNKSPSKDMEDRLKDKQAKHHSLKAYVYSNARWEEKLTLQLCPQKNCQEKKCDIVEDCCPINNVALSFTLLQTEKQWYVKLKTTEMIEQRTAAIR